jgi:hypothetical protein
MPTWLIAFLVGYLAIWLLAIALCLMAQRSDRDAEAGPLLLPYDSRPDTYEHHREELRHAR